MEILLKSIFGGFVIGLVLLISKLFGEKLAGVISAVPMIFILSFIFVTVDTKSPEKIRLFLEGGFWGIAFFVGSILGLYWLSQYSDRYWMNIALVYLLWFSAVGTWVYVFKR